MAGSTPGRSDGIEVRHSSWCATGEGRRCNCIPTYRAQVWSERDATRIRKSFRTLAEAKAWRIDSRAAARAGLLRAPSPRTIEEAALAWLEGAKAGVVRNRSGDQASFRQARTRGSMKSEKPQSDWSLVAMLIVMTITNLWFLTSAIGYA